MNRIFISVLIVCVLFCFGCTTNNIHKASLSGEIEKVLAYIQDEEDINVKDKNGMTPLMYAVSLNNIRIMEILISNGADVNIKNNKGQTSLQQAYEHNYFEAFKILLENGAEADFMKNKNIRDSESKTEYYKLSKDFFLYAKLLNIHTEKTVKLFDMYFSIYYSNGYYKKEAEQAFRQFIQDDFHNIANSPDKQRLDNFINTYSKMGKNYYIVTTGSLNIRRGSSAETESIGDYSRGDKIYAIDEQDEWVRTNRGWINRNYTKQILKKIPFVSQYIKKASEYMKNKSKKEDIVSPSPPASVHKRPAFKLKKNIHYKTDTAQQTVYTNNNSSTDIQKEMDNVLAKPRLDSLENFIQKYKENTEYAAFVEIARKKYKSILLGNEK